MSNDDLDIEGLRRLTEAATPGPWTVRKIMREPTFDEVFTAQMAGAPTPEASMRGCFVQAPRLDPNHPYDIEVLGEDETLYPTRMADCEFIAAANPATVRALLERLDESQARVEALRAALGGLGDAISHLSSVAAAGHFVLPANEFEALEVAFAAARKVYAATQQPAAPEPGPMSIDDIPKLDDDEPGPSDGEVRGA